MKRILITGGPTDEAIDEVMKITNMSTGSLSLSLADRAVKKDDAVTLILNSSVLRSAAFAAFGFEENKLVKVVPVDSTQDMYDALKAESSEHYDLVIHASAVGDYKPQFSFRMEDMAEEIAENIRKNASAADTAFANGKLEKLILETLTDPECKVNDDTKISSYEPNLTVKLTLTTKLISNLKTWFPDAMLVGCKLLENVSKEHLIDVATKLCIKNDMDYIMANDLAEIRAGRPVRYLVTKDGYSGIALNEPGGPALLDYVEENWF